MEDLYGDLSTSAVSPKVISATTTISQAPDAMGEAKKAPATVGAKSSTNIPDLPSKALINGHSSLNLTLEYLIQVRLELVGEKMPELGADQDHTRKELLAACLSGGAVPPSWSGPNQQATSQAQFNHWGNNSSWGNANEGRWQNSNWQQPQQQQQSQQQQWQ